jgi:peroxiredoxin
MTAAIAQKSNVDRILMVLMVLLAGALCYFVSAAFQETVIQAGDKAPDFEITTDSGQAVSLKQFGGKLLVLNFWATWCPPCVEEIPSLNRFQEELKPQGVVVVAVSVDRNAAKYKQFLQRRPVSFQTARDPESSIPAKYGTFKYPETYIINAKGEVVWKFIGPEDWSNPQLLQRVKSFL